MKALGTMPPRIPIADKAATGSESRRVEVIARQPVEDLSNLLRSTQRTVVGDPLPRQHESLETSLHGAWVPRPLAWIGLLDGCYPASSEMVFQLVWIQLSPLDKSLRDIGVP